MKIVIFAGGYGTRMWPASRKSFPKQFYPIIKGKSFFQQTISRFKKRFKAEDIMISTEEAYMRFVHEQAPEIPKKNLIIEPERRDLLGAVGLVAAVVNKLYPSEVMFISWSDHFISEDEKFLDVVETAVKYTKDTGRPTSVDEKPPFPSSAWGWRKIGKKVTTLNGHTLYEIEEHKEKPDIAAAKKMFESKKWLIHTGYGAWRSDLMLDYYKEYRPKEYSGLMKISEVWGTDRQDRVLREEYHKFEKTSVEYAIYEKLPHDLRLTIPMSVGWEDAGTWRLFYSAMIEKGEENVLEGGVETEFLDSKGNLIVGRRNKLFAIIGLENLVVVDTEDAVLICPMDQTEKVKDIFKKLEKDKPRYID